MQSPGLSRKGCSFLCACSDPGQQLPGEKINSAPRSLKKILLKINKVFLGVGGENEREDLQWTLMLCFDLFLSYGRVERDFNSIRIIYEYDGGALIGSSPNLVNLLGKCCRREGGGVGSTSSIAVERKREREKHIAAFLRLGRSLS